MPSSLYKIYIYEREQNYSCALFNGLKGDDLVLPPRGDYLVIPTMGDYLVLPLYERKVQALGYCLRVTLCLYA